MPSISKRNLAFEIIISDKDLNELVVFLENGFQWNKKFSILINKNLPLINSQFEPKGVAIKSNNKIVGGMLFFYQGNYVVGNKKKPIINLSSWYVDKNFRGLPTISLVRFMLETLDNCIITNYSANKTAAEILLLSGFKTMALERASIYFYQTILYKENVNINHMSPKDIMFDKDIDIQLKHGNDVSYLCIQINFKDVHLITKKKIFKRSIFGIKFNMNALHIIWSSDENLIAEYWKPISNALLKYAKCSKLIYDFEEKILPKNYLPSKNNYLIYSNDPMVKFIRPVQSEMNIF